MEVIVTITVGIDYNSDMGMFSPDATDEEIIEAVRDDMLSEPTDLLIGGTWQVERGTG